MFFPRFYCLRLFHFLSCFAPLCCTHTHFASDIYSILSLLHSIIHRTIFCAGCWPRAQCWNQIRTSVSTYDHWPALTTFYMKMASWNMHAHFTLFSIVLFSIFNTLGNSTSVHLNTHFAIDRRILTSGYVLRSCIDTWKRSPWNGSLFCCSAEGGSRELRNNLLAVFRFHLHCPAVHHFDLFFAFTSNALFCPNFAAVCLHFSVHTVLDALINGIKCLPLYLVRKNVLAGRAQWPTRATCVSFVILTSVTNFGEVTFSSVALLLYCSFSFTPFLCRTNEAIKRIPRFDYI